MGGIGMYMKSDNKRKPRGLVASTAAFEHNIFGPSISGQATNGRNGPTTAKRVKGLSRKGFMVQLFKPPDGVKGTDGTERCLRLDD
jgi:hypothetical protein